MKRLVRQYFQWGVAAAIATAAAASIISPAKAELIATPEAITLAGTRNRTVSTTLTLSGETDAITLEPAVSDLRRADGVASIAASGIVIKPDSAVDVPANAPTQLTVTIDLGEATGNGELTGVLYLYHDGGRQVVPLTVKVKASPVAPWILMLLGLGLGTILSIYRTHGQPRDELVVKIRLVTKKIEAEGSDLDANYKDSIETRIDAAFSAIEDKDWDTAKNEVKAAKQRMETWTRLKPNWLAQLEFGEQEVVQLFNGSAEKRLTEGKLKTLYMVQVKQNLDGIYRRLQMGETTNPQTLSTEFSEVRRQIADFEAGWALVQELRNRSQFAPFTPENQDLWKQEFNEFETRLKNLEPKSENYQAWLKELNVQKDKLNDAIRQAQQSENPEQHATTDGDPEQPTPDDGLRPRSVVDRLPAPLAMVLAPELSGVTQPPSTEEAENNLFWAGLIARLASLILLAGVGMVELYGSKSTFGADPLRDYFALLAWGFGAEMTRESVAKATRDMGLSSAK